MILISLAVFTGTSMKSLQLMLDAHIQVPKIHISIKATYVYVSTNDHSCCDISFIFVSNFFFKVDSIFYHYNFTTKFRDY